MNTEQWHRVKTVVQSILETEPGNRAGLIEKNCADDPFLRAQVAALLDAYEKAGNFIETPAFIGKIQTFRGIASRDELAAGQRIGRYQIISLIGRGGMGEVYLAEDTRLRRKTALKVLPAELIDDRERLERFEQEARAASALNHPNILTIYEIGETAETKFIATEYIEGQTLQNLLKSRLQPAAALDIAIQTASALQAAHDAGIVHLDIKPANIMIRPDGLVKILDFGIAKLTEKEVESGETRSMIGDREKTNPGIILGTARYMSPEQERGLNLDVRTDIWSFGIVLSEMLGWDNRPPAGENGFDASVHLAESDQLSGAGFFPRQISAELERIITKTLQKNPNRRYRTGGEMLGELQRLKQKFEIESHLEEYAWTEISSGRPRAAHFVTSEAARRRPPSIFGVRQAIIFAALIVLGLIAFVYLQMEKGGTVPANPPQIRSLAVLPLKSIDGAENYLALGLADAIIRRISRTGKLIVRPTSSIRPYLNREADALSAARELNVDAVLEGSVQQMENRLRVSINMLRSSDGASLWADSFEMPASDIFTIQDIVAHQVTAQLNLQLDSAEQAILVKPHTSDRLAYEYYLKGVNSLDLRQFGPGAKPQLEATINLFKRAIEADPNYALAHAQLAFSYAWMAVFIEPEQSWVDRAKMEIHRAETLDPQIAEIHMARYIILYSAFEGFQIEAAIRELRLAQKLNPNIGHDELGNLYQHLGLESLAERELQRAIEVDPTSEYVKNTILGAYRITKKFDEWNAANELYFENRTKPNSWFYLSQERLAEAEALLREESAAAPDNAVVRSRKALLFALKKDFRSAQAEIDFIIDNYPAKNLAYHHLTYDFACVYALAGKSDKSVKWLRETAAAGFPSYPLFERDPFLNPIRQTPEFKQFIAEMRNQFETYKLEFGNNPN